MDQDSRKAPRIQLPAVIETPRERLRPSLTTLHADFISQLIAERDHLLQRRSAGITEAMDAYAQSSRRAERRMPAGYRKTLLA